MKAHYLACLALLPLAASAIEPGPSSPQQAETENWMTLQINGRAASSTPQRTSPAEREQALQRWLDSNKHPIPEFFESESGGGSSGGSSQ
ncbi:MULTISPECIES: DUF3613 domain-containing protein [Pseudomonas]|uniref:DUF3613 domain-containing protein n=1 Tax=Pseudomonas TaxID=286 RepID=UPI000CFBC4BF|nr:MULTISPECIES: DUF3613 domain-containing protein [Pseudomonas]PQZ92427.1 hypothetical protein CQ048_07850 [Pseudomonas trivialis]PRB24485.1 hypothetical protein CQ041_19555 [Pseudomonas sp. MYb60]